MTSIFDPAEPAGAFDAFVHDAARASAAQHAWGPGDGPLPALYISHGAPPHSSTTHRGSVSCSPGRRTCPSPRSILIVSAHWESAPATTLSASAAATPLVYNFGGFHPRYYQMTYPTPDAGELGRRVAASLPDREPVHEHPRRGLDHGAWVPLKVMYPLGDVPVLQLSLPTHDPRRLHGHRQAPPAAAGGRASWSSAPAS